MGNKKAYGGNATNANTGKLSGGSLEEGINEKMPCPEGYEPRTSGEGERPSPSKSEKAKGFTIKG